MRLCYRYSETQPNRADLAHEMVGPVGDEPTSIVGSTGCREPGRVGKILGTILFDRYGCLALDFSDHPIFPDLL